MAEANKQTWQSPRGALRAPAGSTRYARAVESSATRCSPTASNRSARTSATSTGGAPLADAVSRACPASAGLCRMALDLGASHPRARVLGGLFDQRVRQCLDIIEIGVPSRYRVAAQEAVHQLDSGVNPAGLRVPVPEIAQLEVEVRERDCL